MNQILSIFGIFTQRAHVLFGSSFTLISGPIFSLEVFLFLLFLIILVHGNSLTQEYERQLNEIWVGFFCFLLLRVNLKFGYPQSLCCYFFFLLLRIVWRTYWERAQTQAAGIIYVSRSFSH